MTQFPCNLFVSGPLGPADQDVKRPHAVRRKLLLQLWRDPPQRVSQRPFVNHAPAMAGEEVRTIGVIFSLPLFMGLQKRLQALVDVHVRIDVAL